MRRGWLAAVAGALVLLGGCSSPGGENGLSEEASAALSEHMADVRAAVAEEEPAAAQQALDALHSEARSRAEAGEISSQRLAAIGTAVDNVERWLDEAGPEPEPEPQPEGEPEKPDPEPQPGKGNNGKDKDKDKDNGEGNGNNGEGRGPGADEDDDEDDD